MQPREEDYRRSQRLASIKSGRIIPLAFSFFKVDIFFSSTTSCKAARSKERENTRAGCVRVHGKQRKSWTGTSGEACRLLAQARRARMSSMRRVICQAPPLGDFHNIGDCCCRWHQEVSGRLAAETTPFTRRQKSTPLSLTTLLRLGRRAVAIPSTTLPVSVTLQQSQPLLADPTAPRPPSSRCIWLRPLLILAKLAASSA